MSDKNLTSVAIMGMCSWSLFSVDAWAYDGSCRSVSDVEDLPAKHWCEVPGSRLDSAEKRPEEFDDWDGNRSVQYESFQRTLGIEAVTDAWNSAALDTRRNCLLVFGGGHNDYGGNEIYSFCLSSLSWSRLTDPTVFPNRGPQFVNSDGTPISRHTYGGLAYLEHADKFFAFDGAPDAAGGGCGVTGTWTFDLSSRESMGEYVSSQWALQTVEEEPEHNCDNAAAYDARTNLVIFKSAQGTHTYDIGVNAWREVSQESRLNEDVTLVVDSSRQLLAEVGGGATALWAIDNDFLGGRVVTTGAKSVENADDPGLVYDSSSRQIVGWYGGTTVYTFDVPTRTWTAVPAAQTNVTDPGAVTTSGGVFGRFAYSSALNIYIYVNHATDNVMLYRLTDAKPIVSPEPPSDLQAN